MQKTVRIITIVAVVFLLTVVIILVQRRIAHSPSSSSNATQKSINNHATVTYDGDSFEPQTTTVSAGGTLKIINQSQENIVVAPSHETAQAANAEINPGNIDPGVSKTITLTIRGEWGFYNQKHPSERAAVVVK